MQIGHKGRTPEAAVKITKHPKKVGNQSNEDETCPWLFRYEYVAKETRPKAEPEHKKQFIVIVD